MRDRIELRNLTAEDVERIKQDGRLRILDIRKQPDGLFWVSVLSGDPDFTTDDPPSPPDSKSK